MRRNSKKPVIDLHQHWYGNRTYADALERFDAIELFRQCNSILPIEKQSEKVFLLGIDDSGDIIEDAPVFYDDNSQHFEIEGFRFYDNYIPSKGGVTSFEIYNIPLDRDAPENQSILFYKQFFKIHLIVYWTGQTKSRFGKQIPQGFILRKTIELE